MNKTIKKILSLVIAVAMLTAIMTTTLSVSAEEKSAVTDKISSTAEYYLSLYKDEMPSYGSEWTVMSLARADRLTDEIAQGYYENIEAYVTENGSEKLNASKSTENSRVIIALSSIGKDARDVAGYNLLKPLADFEYIKKQGVNGPLWALIAVDTYGYEIPVDETVAEQTTREKMIDYILGQQLENGGWTFYGSDPDADLTGMVIQAFAPYYNTNEKVKTAVDTALAVMSEKQTEDGGYVSWGATSPESTAQMITALASLGINPETDERFIKNGNTLVDSLMTFAVENGFAHSQGGNFNQMTTEQALYSMIAYQRVEQGKTSLYDMSDVNPLRYDINKDGHFNINDCTLIQKYISDLAVLDEQQIKIADVNNDGRVSIIDATTLQKLLVA